MGWFNKPRVVVDGGTIDALIAEARQDGRTEAYRVRDVRHERLRDEIRSYKSALWAAASSAGEQGLRIHRVAIAAYSQDAELQTADDWQTGDLIVFARPRASSD